MWLPKLILYCVKIYLLLLYPGTISGALPTLNQSLLNSTATSLSSPLNTSSISSTLSSLDPTKLTSLLNTTSQNLANLTQLLNTTDVTSLTNVLNATATNSSNISATLNSTEQARLLVLLNTTASNLQNLTAMLNSSTLPPLNSLLGASSLNQLNLTLLNGTDLSKLASLLNTSLASLNSSTLNGFLSSTSLNDTVKALTALVNNTGLALTDAAFSNNGVNCNCSVNSKTVTEKTNLLHGRILPEKINNIFHSYSAILVQAFGQDYNLSKAIMSTFSGASFADLCYNATIGTIDWAAKMNATARNFLGKENLLFVNQTVSSAIQQVNELIRKTSNHFGVRFGRNNPWLTMRYPGQVMSAPPTTYPWSWVCNCMAGFMSFISATSLSTSGNSDVARQMNASLAQSIWSSSFTKIEYNGNSSNSSVELAVYFNNFSANLVSFFDSFVATNLSSMKLNVTCYEEYNVTDIQAILDDVQDSSDCIPITGTTINTSTAILPSTIPPSLTTSNISGVNPNISGTTASGITGIVTGNNTSNYLNSTTNSVSNSSGNSTSNSTSNATVNSASNSTTNSTAAIPTNNLTGNSTVSSPVANNGTTVPGYATTGKNNSASGSTTISTSTKATSPQLKLLKFEPPSNPTPMPFTNFMLTITLPAVAVLVLITVGCMCCLQADCGKKNVAPSA